MGRSRRRKASELKLTRTHLLAVKLCEQIVDKIRETLQGQADRWSDLNMTVTDVPGRFVRRRVDIELQLYPVQQVFIETTIILQDKQYAIIEFRVALGHGRRETWIGNAVQEANGQLVITHFDKVANPFAA